MKILVFLRTLHRFLQAQPPPPTLHSSLIDDSQVSLAKNIGQIWQTELFFNRHAQPSKQYKVIVAKLIAALKVYWFVMVTLTVLTMGSLLSQPFILRYIKQSIATMPVYSLVFVFLGYKIVTSLLYVVSDYCSIVLGVRMYSLAIIRLLLSEKSKIRRENSGTGIQGQEEAENEKGDNKGIIWTIFEDDCERLLNLPYASVNTAIKIIELVVLCALIIIHLPHHKLTVASAYFLYVFVTVLLARSSFLVSRKLLGHKEKRLDFSRCSANQIRKQRELQLGSVKVLMLIDGLGITVPWLLNTSLMVLIYGLNDLSEDDRFWVLTVFGLLRISISGLGYNMNLLAQIRTSLLRINDYLSSSKQQAQSQQSSTTQYVREYDEAFEAKRQKPVTLSKTAASIQNKCFPYFKILLALIALIVFGAHYGYSQVSRNIIQGISIFTPFNLSILGMQLLSPILLLGFMCWVGLSMSRTVYQAVLDRLPNKNAINNNGSARDRQQDSTVVINGQPESESKQSSCISGQEMNRLSGDIRLLDRHFYYFSYATISHFLGILASLAYAIVGLGIGWPALIMFLLTLSTLAIISVLFGKLIGARKQMYVSEAIQKGKLLRSITPQQQQNHETSQDIDRKWMNGAMQIFEFKMLGYATESVFMGALYTLTTIISTIFMGCAVTYCQGATASTLIMLVLQLDSQFLMLFIQRIQLQIDFEAIGRCMELTDKKQK